MKLSEAQDELICRWVLGGSDAVGRHSTQTISALIKGGYLDKHGPTAKARAYVEARHRALVEGVRA